MNKQDPLSTEHDLSFSSLLAPAGVCLFRDVPTTVGDFLSLGTGEFLSWQLATRRFESVTNVRPHEQNASPDRGLYANTGDWR